MTVWTSSMESGIRSIDDEHKRLIDFANIVENATENQRSRLCDRKLLASLHTLFRNICEKEEDLMFRIDYPNVDKHMIEHSSIMCRFDLLIMDFEQTGDTAPMVEFVRDWIDTHLKAADTSLASFIQKRKQVNAEIATLNANKAPPGAAPALRRH